MATDKLVDFDHVTDYISREAAYKTLTEYYHHSSGVQHTVLRETLNRVPTADVRPVVMAHWEWDENGMDWNLGAWKCSHCRRKAETWWATDKHYPLRCAGSHFCGNCGADMREVSEDG